MDKDIVEVRTMLSEETNIKKFENILAKVKLTDRELIVLNLKYVRGLKLWEIAEEIGLSHNRVKDIHRKILRKISKELKQ